MNAYEDAPSQAPSHQVHHRCLARGTCCFYQGNRLEYPENIYGIRDGTWRKDVLYR